MMDPAFAGHAGETGGPPFLPHELMGVLALVAGLCVVMLLVGLVALWLLIRIDRRLRTWHRPPDAAPPSTPRQPG